MFLSPDKLILQLMINFAILSVLSYSYYLALIIKEGRFHFLSPPIIILPFSLVAWICMQLPIEFFPGIIIDARVIIVALAGFCGGWIPGLVTAVIVSYFRYLIGGIGLWPGIVAILAAGVIGSVFHKYFVPDFRKLLYRLPILGFGVAVTGLATSFLLPEIDVLPVLKKITVPVLVSYTCGLTYAGLLLGVSAYRKKIRYRLKNSEQGFRDLFQYSPVSLWLEDFTQVYNKLQEYSHEELKGLKKTDPRLMDFFKSIIILDVNKAVLELIKAASVQELLERLGETMGDESLDIFKDQLLAMREGKRSLQCYSKIKDLMGNELNVQLSWFALNGPSDKYNRVLLSIVDITEKEKHQEHLDLLVRETHHRVSNNLNIISGMIEIEKDRIGKVSQEKVLNALQTKIASISLVHNQLYRSRDLHYVQADEYISSIAQQVIEISGDGSNRIKLELNCDSFKILSETALSCGLLVNELVTNAVKYAFPDQSGGTISVSFKKNPDSIIIKVVDNGVGFSGWKNKEHGEGLGGSIIYALVDKLEGTSRLLEQTRGFGIEISFSES